MSSCVSHDILLKHFIRTMDIWERSPSPKKIYTRTLKAKKNFSSK